MGQMPQSPQMGQQSQQFNPQQQGGFSDDAMKSFARAVETFKSSPNQQQTLQALAQVNPQVRDIMNMCNGRDPKQVFMQECQNRGINLQYAFQVLSQFGIT